MGYVEDIKKINAMAKELISHGMATSFDEAVQKATKMLGEDASVTHSRDFEPAKPSSVQPKVDQATTQQPQEQQYQEQQPIPKQSQQPQQQDSKDERTGMTWQQAMAKNNEYIVKMLKDFQRQMQDHHSRITHTESNIHELSKRQAKMSEMIVSVPKGSEEINIEDDEPVQQPRGISKEQPKQEQPRESHPRLGKYKSEDVSIESVFYFGNKK